MRRTPLKRKTPLKRGGSLSRGKGLERGPGPSRKTRIRSRNPERRARMFARNFGERGQAVRDGGCIVAGRGGRCAGDIVAAHVRARGMGGCKGDRRELVGLCAKHHDDAGELRTSQREAFEARFGVDLVVEAERIAAELDDQGFE